MTKAFVIFCEHGERGLPDECRESDSLLCKDTFLQSVVISTLLAPRPSSHFQVAVQSPVYTSSIRKLLHYCEEIPCTVILFHQIHKINIL